MVKMKRKYFLCRECGLVYEEKELAKQCEKFCRKYKSCNLELIKKAAKL